MDRSDDDIKADDDDFFHQQDNGFFINRIQAGSSTQTASSPNRYFEEQDPDSMLT